MTKEELIVEVLSGFNFDKVHKAMVAVDWKWACRDGTEVLAVPSRDRIVATARHLLEMAFKEKGTCRTGGFSAWFDEAHDDAPANVGLMFTLACNDVDTLEVIS